MESIYLHLHNFFYLEAEGGEGAEKNPVRKAFFLRGKGGGRAREGEHLAQKGPFAAFSKGCKKSRSKNRKFFYLEGEGGKGGGAGRGVAGRKGG